MCPSRSSDGPASLGGETDGWQQMKTRQRYLAHSVSWLNIFCLSDGADVCLVSDGIGQRVVLSCAIILALLDSHRQTPVGNSRRWPSG